MTQNKNPGRWVFKSLSFLPPGRHYWVPCVNSSSSSSSSSSHQQTAPSWQENEEGLTVTENVKTRCETWSVLSRSQAAAAVIVPCQLLSCRKVGGGGFKKIYSPESSLQCKSESLGLPSLVIHCDCCTSRGVLKVRE